MNARVVLARILFRPSLLHTSVSNVIDAPEVATVARFAELVGGAGRWNVETNVLLLANVATVTVRLHIVLPQTCDGVCNQGRNLHQYPLYSAVCLYLVLTQVDV